MSKAPDKSHTLFINLFILVLPLSSAKENFLEGKSVLFLLALLYFLPSARRCLCLCLPVFHKLSLEMSDSCLHQNLYPMTVLLNKKQTCCENTWCTATFSALTLSKSIKAIDSLIFEAKHVYYHEWEAACRYIYVAMPLQCIRDMIWIFFTKTFFFFF